MADGTMQQQRINLADIERLILSDSPASKQVAEIRRYLSMLQGPNFLDRELAEEKLSDSNVGGRFVSLIKSESDHPKLEVRYRIERILDRLKNSKNETISEFDVLVMKNGNRLEGDAGDFQLDCRYREQPVSLSREAIRLIARPRSLPQPVNNDANVQVEVFHRHEGNFFQPGQTLIDFETAPGGSELGRNTDVSNVFVPDGLLLDSEKEGFVGISGYGFKFKTLPPKNNSICVFETVGRSYPVRFKGVMEMRFCMPNQCSVVAGVHEIGFFMARVTHSRDFIVEAYNSDGQILAYVESSDQNCVFAGIKSTEPITLVRILSNPYLFRIRRNIDEDFAVDQLCFSPPVPIVNAKDAEPDVLSLRNGDLLKTQSFDLSADGISLEVNSIDQRIRIPAADIKTFHFGNSPVPPNIANRQWAVMLDDRSVLNVEPGKSYLSSLFGGLKFTPDQITGIWFAANQVRFPFKDDFKDSKPVMVFPTCRLVPDDLEFVRQGYTWGQAEKIEQELRLNDENEDDEAEDPTPNVDSVDYVESSPENIPTMWIKAPRGQPVGSGMLRLVDGQQLVLGGSSGFQISDIKEDSISVSLPDGRTQAFPLKQLLSIEFPDR